MHDLRIARLHRTLPRPDSRDPRFAADKVGPQDPIAKAIRHIQPGACAAASGHPADPGLTDGPCPRQCGGSRCTPRLPARLVEDPQDRVPLIRACFEPNTDLATLDDVERGGLPPLLARPSAARARITKAAKSRDWCDPLWSGATQAATDHKKAGGGMTRRRRLDGRTKASQDACL